MTEERRYGINWVDLIIKVILLILFVLLIVWLFPMPKLDTFYDKVFNENIQTMKTAARDYYTKDRLPSTIGETKTMSLEQLVNNKLVLEFSDKNGKACDTANSYVQVTKTLDSEYALKVQLTCGDETDYIIDTIGCNGTCLLSDVNATANNTAAKNTANEDDEEYTEDVKFASGNRRNSSYNGTTYSTNNGGSTVYYYPLSGGVSYSNNGGSTSSNSTTTTTYKKTTTKKTTIIKNGNTNNNGLINLQPSTNNTYVNNNRSYVNRNNGTLYYEQAKIVKSYSNWIEGYRTGNNVQTKTEKVDYYYYTKGNSYSNNATSEYRTTSWIEYNDAYSGKVYSYELQLTDIPSSVTNVSIITNRYFNSSDYQAYLNNRNRNIYMTGNDMLHNSSNRSASVFANSALKSGNFSYSLSNPYKSNGVWRVRVTINIRNRGSVPAFYDNYLGKNVYFVPVYFKTSYSSNGYNGGSTQRYVDTAANAYKYSGYTRTYAYSDTKTYYRTFNEYVDYNQTKWTTSRNVSGYQFTGNTQYR